MTRTLTAGGIESLLSQDSRDVWLVLLTIDTTKGKLYLVNNNESVVSRGKTFQAYPFEITPPDDALDKTPTASVVIGNVDLLIVQTIREVVDPPRFTIEIIRFDYPDIVEMMVSDLIMTNVQWTESTVSATLQIDDIFNQPFPSGSGTYSPRQFPSMF